MRHSLPMRMSPLATTRTEVSLPKTTSTVGSQEWFRKDTDLKTATPSKSGKDERSSVPSSVFISGGKRLPCMALYSSRRSRTTRASTPSSGLTVRAKVSSGYSHDADVDELPSLQADEGVLGVLGSLSAVPRSSSDAKDIDDGHTLLLLPLCLFLCVGVERAVSCCCCWWEVMMVSTAALRGLVSCTAAQVRSSWPTTREYTSTVNSGPKQLPGSYSAALSRRSDSSSASCRFLLYSSASVTVTCSPPANRGTSSNSGHDLPAKSSISCMASSRAIRP
mmetsp:Transcript_18103/g.51526  ORF Transcript_18103/g.51526 Transcript_18103/m.51526 type:complete len:278 (+) Transcript_18103:367-1200(+)